MKYAVNYRRKTGPKPKVLKNDRRRIQSILDIKKAVGQKCTSREILNDLQVNVSLRTIQRNIRSMHFEYRNIPCKFILSAENKKKRVEMAKQYIINGTVWKDVVFSDEKKFCLEGCDSYYSWIRSGQSAIRIKKVLKSPGIMVWAMLLPNGLLSYRIMNGKQNSESYIQIIRESALPILKLNYSHKMTFQQDNAPIHSSKTSKKFFNDLGIELLPWAPYSPDINLIENVWSILADDIYSNGRIKNLKELEIKLKNSIEQFNTTKHQVVLNLYNSMPERLISIIQKRGDRINY